MASNGVPPPIPGRRPPPSGPPPPIPSRVDLGEATVQAVSSTKEQSKDELPNKGSPKLKAKGRPEISIVSARPMDSTGVIPPPSVPSQPIAAPEMPKVPQKPGRKSKGREPPPRPKTRPVSELTLGTDEQDMGLASGEEEREVEEGTSKSDVLKEGAVSRVAGPFVPAKKVPEEKSEASDVSEEKNGLSPADKSELTQRVEQEMVKDDHSVRKPAAKPTVIRAKPKENITQNNSKPPVEVEGVKETKQDSNGIPVENAATGKKVKPTVIIAAKPPKKAEAQTEEQKVGKEPSNEIAKPVTTSQGGKPPPPAKKPKPPVKAKPISTLERQSKPPSEENKPDSTAAPKPKMRPTVIVAAKPPKISEAAKPDEESSKKKEEDQPQVKPSTAPAPVEAVQGAHDKEETAAAPAVKPKRFPTIIRAAPRPDAPGTGEQQKAPKRPQRGPSIKAPPRRPVSAPAEENKKQEKLAADEQDEPSKSVSEQVVESVQEKTPKPQRPVSLHGVKDSEVLKDVKKLDHARSPVEESDALTRKGSRKRPPPPRPPTVEPAGEERDLSPETPDKKPDADEKAKGKVRPPPPRPPTVEPVGEKGDLTSETHDQKQDSDEKFKGKTRPPPPRPPTGEPVGEKGNASPEAHDKTQHDDETSKGKTRPPAPRPPTVESVGGKGDSSPETHAKTQGPDEKSKRKNRPPRPSSRVLDEKHPKHSHIETEESHTHEKTKPVRPAPVAPNQSHVTSKNVHEAETRTVAQSSADDHVQETSHARDSARGADHSTAEVHEKEKSEKASSKAKPKPARLAPSSTSTTKNKPHRPSAPATKTTKEPKKKTAPTQVSSVCETYIEPSAIALYDYEPTAIDDLSFNAGDEITLVKKIDDGWYIGRLGDQEGMFPVKFVEIIEDLPQETAPETQPVTAPERSPFDVMALYDFHGNQQDGELVFAAGENIHVIEKIDDDWLRGEYRGRTGAFPCSFVDISTELINKLPQSEQSATVPKSDDGESSDSGIVLHCKALFDYDSEVPDDLSFHAGDVIKIKRKISEEWFEGEINGRVGMFPAAYVEIVKDMPKEKNKPDEVAKHHVVEYGTALYDFTGSAADELSFKKGDKIEITERVSDDWLRGKHSGREGMLPRAFVQLSKAEPEPGLQSVIKNKKQTPKAKALFDFDGEFEDELSFKTGDVIVLLERINDEWFQGEINKKFGRFPAAFVEVLTPLS
ncbi:hypothetical protein ACROYT_G018333 [Oculina patagonica]